MLSLPEVFAGPSSLDVNIDPLTHSLIDSNTVILLNKVDCFPLTTSHTQALFEALQKDGKTWHGAETSHPFWPISVKGELGLRSLSNGLTDLLKTRSFTVM